MHSSMMSGRNSTHNGPRNSPANRTRYVTRACDACKKRKSKCDGQEPCRRCQAADIQCSYDTVYRRVHRHKKPPQTLRREHNVATSASPNQVVDNSTSSPFVGAQEYTGGEDAANTSVHAFLRRISEHLSLAGQRLPRNLLSKPMSDQLFSTDSDLSTPLILAPKETSLRYASCYFEHANVTYRYIPRTDFHVNLDQLYDQHEPILGDNARVAATLLILGIGCIWSASDEKQPVDEYKTKALRLLESARIRLDKATRLHQVSIELLTAHVLKCQLECAANRYNDAWLSLGTAVRLGQMMGIHQVQRGMTDPVDKYKAEGLFWAMFMIDRYLSVAFGRPMMIQEEDITIPLPSEPDDSVLPRLGADEGRVMAGVSAHVKITRIIGHTIKRLYTGTRLQNKAQRQNVIVELEAELQEWTRTTPTFFHPPRSGDNSNEQRGFYDVCWIFRRQQRTVQSAFHFANMLIYRGSLLYEFLHHVPSTPAPLPKPASVNVEKCVESARAMAVIAADIADDDMYNGVFWTSSHFIFCAISILLVYHSLYQGPYDRDEFEALLEKAIKGHQRLDDNQSFRDRGNTFEARNLESFAHGSLAGMLTQMQTQIQQEIPTTSPVGLATPGIPDNRNTFALPTPVTVPPFLEPTATDFSSSGQIEQAPSRFNETTMSLWSAPDLNVPGGNILNMIMDVGFDDTGSQVDMNMGVSNV